MVPWDTGLVLEGWRDEVIGVVPWDVELVPKGCKNRSIGYRVGPMGCRVGPEGMWGWSKGLQG